MKFIYMTNANRTYIIRVALLTILHFSGLTINAQCNIETQVSNGKTIISAEMEEFWESVGPNNNGDYSYGYALAVGRLYKIKPSDYYLQISTSFSGLYKRNEVIPRRLDISFANGKRISIQAEKYRQIQPQLHVCTFRLSDTDITNFKYGITSLRIIDHRTNKSLSAKPNFNRIFSEQLSCINKY